ncbi:MAG TPA: DUF58 domain-containing protein [Gemmatimonadaceae bacterium]|nr:DUF58 domain-containing protein [Gemmatimonadaceae bacterium]
MAEWRGGRREQAMEPDGGTSGAAAAPAAFLDPVVLSRIGNLELLARTVVEGFINGLHHSPHLGMSLDFAEHRAYMPGDDTRRIDWRLYARTDRFYIKEFEADTNTNFSVLLDVSASMRYGSGPVSKLDYARFLAACLAYFSHGQRDRVGLVTFDADIVEVVPPSAKHLSAVLTCLARARAERAGQLEAPLRKLAEHFRRRSMILLMSDLYAEPDIVLDALRHLRQRGNDVMVIHLLDPAELEFPFDGPGTFEDVETHERRPIVPEYLREPYRALIRAHVAELGRRLGEQGMDYAMFDTSWPLDVALFDFLSKRQRRGRVR